MPNFCYCEYTEISCYKKRKICNIKKAVHSFSGEKSLPVFFPIIWQKCIFLYFQGGGIKRPKIKIPKYIFMSYLYNKRCINGLYHMKCLNWCIYKWRKGLELHFNHGTIFKKCYTPLLCPCIPVLFCQVNFLARFLHSEQNCKILANLLILEQAYHFNCTRNMLEFFLNNRKWLGTYLLNLYEYYYN